jgi:hypothetical protein
VTKRKENRICHKCGTIKPFPDREKREKVKNRKTEISLMKEKYLGRPKLRIPPPNRAKNNMMKIKLLCSIGNFFILS